MAQVSSIPCILPVVLPGLISPANAAQSIYRRPQQLGGIVDNVNVTVAGALPWRVGEEVLKESVI